MTKLITSLSILIAFLFLLAAPTSAGAVVAEPSAQLISNSKAQDVRVETLRKYLASHNSPLAEYAEVFVSCADKYDLDWRLVPAITGVESTFGKRIPQNSYNAYGWVNGEYNFKSWEDSIEIVTRTLRINYLDKGASSIGAIAKRYAPPSSTWAGKVKFFVRKIGPYPTTFTLEV